MKIDYFVEPIGNFGDDLNLWLWPRIFGDAIDGDGSIVLVGAGTILDRGIPAKPLKVICGSGVGYGRLPEVDERWAPAWVRGPLSVRALGLEPELAITDPGILVPGCWSGDPAGSATGDSAGNATGDSSSDPPVSTSSIETHHRVSFVPNHASPVRSRMDGWTMREACEASDVHFIDPEGAVDTVAGEIARSDLVITEAMHGAILADAFRTPWVAVQVYPHVLSFKWWDWSLSLGLGYRPLIFDALATDRPRDGFLRLLEEARSAEPSLSRDDAHHAALTRVEERIGTLRADLASGSLSRRARSVGAEPEATNRYAGFDRAAFLERQERRWQRVHSGLRDLVAQLGPGEGFLLADDDRFGFGNEVAGHPAHHFLAVADDAWARPADEGQAIEGIERLREAGSIRIAAFGWSLFRWLAHHRRLGEHLRGRYQVLIEDDRLICFDLRTVRRTSATDRVRRFLRGAPTAS